MLVVDTHADTLYAMQSVDRPADRPLDVTAEAFVGLTRVQALALFIPHDEPHGAAQATLSRELQMLESLKQDGWRQIASIEDALPDVPNVLLTLEGGEGFGGTVDGVDRLAKLGVRAAALLWNHPNPLGFPAVGGSAEGLTALGRAIVRRMRETHMAVDVSHLNERGFWDVLDAGVAPMASHSNCRALCAHPRNLTDDQLRALFEAGGYVGVNFYPPFLTEKSVATLDDVIDHMLHMLSLGGENHIGIGSDWDGIGQWPTGLRRATELPHLFDRMAQRGFTPALIRQIAGENAKRYFGAI